MKIGVVGTSKICEDLVKAMNEVEGVNVICSYSRSLETSQSFCNKLGIKYPFNDYDKMIESDLIDFIYIASPNSLHYTQCKKALLANKNVIIEKPFCSNGLLAKELIDLAKSKKLFLFEAITTIHNPYVKEIKAFIESISPIRLVQCNMSQYSRKYDLFLNGEKPNIFNIDYSGGVLMDLNVYNIHFITELFGSPNNVSYVANFQDNIDTSGIINLVYDNFICNLLASKNSPSKSFIQIQGEKGYIYVDAPSSLVNSYSVNYRLNSDKNFNKVKDINVDIYHDNYQNEISHIYDIVMNENYNICYELLDHSLVVMEVIDKAKKSQNIIFKEDRNI